MSGVGEEVKRLRQAKGWTQEQLAVYAGSSQPTVNLLEAGKRNPSATTLEKLAQALGVEVADFFPKVLRRSSPEPSLFNGLEDDQRIAIDYNACRAALESFCDHWQPAVSGKQQLDRQRFQDFKADAASLSKLTRELMGAEMTTLGQQYDEEGDPVFYTERSEFGPAVMRFHDLAIRMAKIGKESFDEDLTSDPEMGQLLDLFPKAS
jgi:transcriptional regulator with XRE-family HTH domain